MRKQEQGVRSKESGAAQPVEGCRLKVAGSNNFQLSTFNFQSSTNKAHITHQGFSLIEILVVVALMTIIILGLLLMFQQTQRAFTQSMTQSDVLANGRAVMDLIPREVEQMT